jgi:hypothetical protein
MDFIKKLTNKDIQDIPDNDIGGGFKDSDFVSRTKIQPPP